MNTLKNYINKIIKSFSFIFHYKYIVSLVRLLFCFILFNNFLILFTKINMIFLGIPIPSYLVYLGFNFYFIILYFKTREQKIKFIIIKFIFYIIFIYYGLFLSQTFIYSKSVIDVFLETQLGKYLFQNNNNFIWLGFLVGVLSGYITTFYYFFFYKNKGMSDEIAKLKRLHTEMKVDKDFRINILQEELKLYKMNQLKYDSVKSDTIADLAIKVGQLKTELDKTKEEKEYFAGHFEYYEQDGEIKMAVENSSSYKCLNENYQKICQENIDLNKQKEQLIADNANNVKNYEIDLVQIRKELDSYIAEKKKFEAELVEIKNTILKIKMEYNYSTSNIQPIYNNIFDNFNYLNNLVKLQKSNINYKYKNFEINSCDNVCYSIFKSIINNLNDAMFGVDLSMDFFNTQIHILNMFFDENINNKDNQDILKYIGNKETKNEIINQAILNLQSEVSFLVNDFETKFPVEIIVEQEEKNEDRVFDVPQIQQFPMENFIKQEQVKVEINTEVPVLEQNNDANNFAEYPFLIGIDPNIPDSGIISNVYLEESNLNIDQEEIQIIDDANNEENKNYQIDNK